MISYHPTSSTYQAVLQEFITTHTEYLIQMVYFLRHIPLRSMKYKYNNDNKYNKMIFVDMEGWLINLHLQACESANIDLVAQFITILFSMQGRMSASARRNNRISSSSSRVVICIMYCHV